MCEYDYYIIWCVMRTRTRKAGISAADGTEARRITLGFGIISFDELRIVDRNYTLYVCVCMCVCCVACGGVF